MVCNTNGKTKLFVLQTSMYMIMIIKQNNMITNTSLKLNVSSSIMFCTAKQLEEKDPGEPALTIKIRLILRRLTLKIYIAIAGDMFFLTAFINKIL